ncbi:MAG TPA: hypothetical protein VLS94_08695 [Fusibacter sp.]|nr:hypothetical protein [Fusibacter sp.]
MNVSSYVTKTEPDWNSLLSTEKNAVTYLSGRIKELTAALNEVPINLEKTSLLHRVKWVAEIAYHTLRLILFAVLSKGARADA